MTEVPRCLLVPHKRCSNGSGKECFCRTRAGVANPSAREQVTPQWLLKNEKTFSPVGVEGQGTCAMANGQGRAGKGK